MSDVQNKDNKQQRQLTPREEALEQIAVARRAEFKAETGIDIPSEPVKASPANVDEDADDVAAERERQRLQDIADGKIADPSATKSPEQEAEAQAQAEEEARRTAAEATQRAQNSSLDPSAKIKLKVNGSEMEMTWEEAQRRLQKDVSADLRLEEASRMRREAEDLQRSLQEQQAQANRASKTGDGGEDVKLDPGVTKEFTKALFAGDEDAAAQAFEKAVSGAVKAARIESRGRGDATPVNPAAIAEQVRQQIAIDSALERSKRDYPQLYADPDIEAVAANRINRKVAEGASFSDALDEVQGDFAKKFGWKAAGSGTPTQAVIADRREEKLKRKESLDNPGGLNVKSGVVNEPVTTVHDTIKEMARARGQTV